MLMSIIFLLFIFSLFKLGNFTFTNIELIPPEVILNSTSITKFICTKKKNDYLGFEVNLLRNISSEYIQFSTNHLNDTAIEITLQSFNYIGAFYLLCSSVGKISAGTRSDVIIGKPPDYLRRARRCIVYYDKYLDCTLTSPIIVQAITNGLQCTFRSNEIRHYSQPEIYLPNPKLVDTDSINKTLTLRWFSKTAGHFALKGKMIVYGTIPYFGEVNHTMDMRPNFQISSNFTVEVISSTDLRIEFNHRKFSSITFCHGNLTNDDNIQSSIQRENIRTFDDSNKMRIPVTGLRPNTWYRLCFYCRRQAPFDTISDIACNRYKTLKPPSFSINMNTILIIFCSLLIITAILLIIICKWDYIKRNLLPSPRSEEIDNGSSSTTLLNPPNNVPFEIEIRSPI